MSDPVNPYAAPPADPAIDAASSPQAAWKRYLLIAIALLGVAAGCIEPWLPAGTDLPFQFNLLHLILFPLLVLWWYDLDQRELGNRPSVLFRLLMLVCPGPLLMIPIHFFVTRGRQGWKWTGVAALYLVLVTLLELAAFSISRSVVQWVQA